MSSTLTCLISGVSYQVKSGDNYGNLNAYDALEVRGSLDITIEDYNGTYSFVYGQPVVLSDSNLGVIFQGFVGTDKPTKLGPASPAIEHTLTCFDKQYLVDKRTNYSNYLNWYAGDIIVDFVQNVLSAEGITVAAALRHETTIADFSAGTLTGTVATLDNNDDDGSLELAPAGSDVSFSEATTADFSAGTLTNVTASNNQLSPNTQNAIKMSAFLPISSDRSLGSLSSYIQVKIWTGSITLGASDTLNFDVWISDANPEKVGNCILLFSDLTNSTSYSLYDQNGLSSISDTDLSGYAVNQWYTRQISLSAVSGKTVIAVMATCSAYSVGTYTWYLRNVYLSSHSGSKFFAPTDTAPQLNPPQIYKYAKFIASTMQASVVTTFDPNNSSRISPSHSIDPVKLLKNSFITWAGSTTAQIYVTYNGGSSWIPCTNNAMLPGLPVGANVTGLSMQLKEAFETSNDPTEIPVLDSVSVSLESAPNATKSDIVTSFLTQANWNTGTHSATQATSGGLLELAPYTRNWNDNSTTGQTNFFPSGTSATASSGSYVMTCGSNSGDNTNGFGTSRLDFLGTQLDFTLECDIKTSHTTMEVGITYRQIFWNASQNNTFGYFVGAYGSPGSLTLEFGYGSNSTTNSFTQLATNNVTVTVNTTYHIKVVVNGNHHQIYWNNATTPTIDVVDTTYTQAGGIGLRGFNSDGAASHTATWDNLVLAQQPSGTWTSPSTSVSSLTTCGGSAITWQETGTDNPAQAYAFVQASIDGGSTYQQCTSGQPIPGLTNGVSLTGKSVLIQVLLGTQTNTVPTVSGLVWRVLGAYPGSSGTRTTAPIGIDYVNRANQSGFGTASDGQAWTKTGTGTDAVSSNKLTISNTTGDVLERLGSVTGSDLDATTPFSLSASTMTAGIALRYVDANNYYLLKASTTALSIIKKVSGSVFTLATVSISLSTNTLYWLRFRVAGTSPVTLYGNVWLDGTLEPTIDSTTYQWNDNNWTLTATES